MFQEAKSKFEKLLKKHPSSPRGLYGRAFALDKLSEVKQSNELLERCIEEYNKVIDLPLKKVPKELALKAGRRCADRQSFRGNVNMYSKLYATPFHQFLLVY